MSFIFYFAVLLVAGATALFGLDLMTAPLPPERSQVASTAPTTKLAQREADKKEQAEKQANTGDAALSPVYPAAPSGNKDVRMVYPPTIGAGPSAPSKSAETTGSSSAENAENASTGSEPQSQPTQQAAAVTPSKNPDPPAASQPPRAEPQAASSQKAEPAKPETPAPAAASPNASAVQPASQQSAGRCDISACAAAYHSFRASDCTYQSFDGPRRVCEKPPQGVRQQTAERAPAHSLDSRTDRAVRRMSKEDELSAVARRVKAMTSSADDDADSLDTPPSRGRRVIVIERSYRGGYTDDDD
jgi:hypothetical protein